MNLTITPARLRGALTPPPSKSQAHRLILCAALADGVSTIGNIALSQDIKATLSCMSALGAGIEFPDARTLRLRGIGGSLPRRPEALPRFDCGESGSTLRFLIPVALAAAGGGSFTGRGRLMERPQKPYFDLFTEKGIPFRQEDGILTVNGTLSSGEYRLEGNVSSQFFTGLLYALPLLEGDSKIISTTELESVGYINMTRRAMEEFGVVTGHEGLAFHVPGGQRFQPRDTAVEADWSQAAFWYAAQTVGNDVTVTGMNEDSLQLDRMVARYSDMIRKDGAVSLDVRHCPDLVPPLAAMGALMDGTLYLKNAGRLRIKESDRLATVTAALNAMGASVTEETDSLIIEGKPSLPGGATVNCCNDHRIAMMAAIAATGCQQPVTLLGAQCVAKSYPDFWEDYRMLGGLIHEHTGE